MNKSFDVIVVGLGGMGSAVACHLALRGLRVLGLEQHQIGHTLGSSHGVNRIIRKPYYENAAYVPLVLRAYELWRELEAMTGVRLLHVTGGVDAGPPQSRTILGAVAACTQHGLAHDLMSAADLHRRFPAFNLPRDMLAVFSPESGFVMSEAAIHEHLRVAAANRAEIKLGAPLSGVKFLSGRVVAETEDGPYEAPQLVLAAGAWMGDLVPALKPIAVPERQVVGWFQPLEPDLFALRRFPVFTMDVEEGIFYGFPEFGVPGFKFARHRHPHQHQSTTPDTVDRSVRPADEAMLRVALDRYFPKGAGALIQSATCLYTNTPDEDFIIDRHPDHPEVLLLSPCSGHGYKFCSVVGEIAADLVIDGVTRHDIRFLSLDRFARRD